MLVSCMALGCIPPPPDLRWDCRDFTSAVAPGFGLLWNNVWNKKPANEGTQCIATTTAGEPAWKWSYSGSRVMPVSFPAVIIGWQPWQQQSTEPVLPSPLSRARSLAVEFDIEVHALGVHNQMLEFWLVDSALVSPRSITEEIMIWLVSTGMTPAGRRIATEEIQGVVFDVWQGQREHDDEGVPRTWLATTYVNRGTLSSGKLRLAPFLRPARPESAYLASVELGTEVATGNGHARVRRFELSPARK